MTFWDLRQAIESSIPLWAYVVLIVVLNGGVAVAWYKGMK